MQCFFSPAGSYVLVHQPTEGAAESDQARYVCASQNRRELIALAYRLVLYAKRKIAALKIYITAYAAPVLLISSGG